MNKNRKGFTLIELLCVVAIISILAGIAYISYDIGFEPIDTSSTIIVHEGENSITYHCLSYSTDEGMVVFRDSETGRTHTIPLINVEITSDK